MVEAQARAKGLRLGLFIAPDTPHLLNGDRRHLQEMLINLAGNAVKFTESGSVTISAVPVPPGEGECRIRFEVSDTGIGIAPEAHAKIFESFTQADESIVNRYGGTGLGLALCKRLAESLGGAIGVESVGRQGKHLLGRARICAAPASACRSACERAPRRGADRGPRVLDRARTGVVGHRRRHLLRRDGGRRAARDRRHRRNRANAAPGGRACR